MFETIAYVVEALHQQKHPGINVLTVVLIWGAIVLSLLLSRHWIGC